MVKKKKVAIVIGRYYLTLPIIIGYNDLYDWEISVIDLGFDKLNIEKDFFYHNIPKNLSIYILYEEKEIIQNFLNNRYDYVIVTSSKFELINNLRINNIIPKLFIFVAAFSKPPNIKKEFVLIKKLSLVINLINRIVSNPQHFILKLIKRLELVLKINKEISSNKLETFTKPIFDKILIWNNSEHLIYPEYSNCLIKHPYHLFLSKYATIKTAFNKILIAHNGDPLYYTKGYNDLIQAIISKYGDSHLITIKLHPLYKSIPNFKGNYEIIYKQMNESKLNEYKIFINEDSYFGVELFFRGLFIINYGLKNSKSSNIDFSHFWSINTNEIINKIDFLTNNWVSESNAHLNYINDYYKDYRSYDLTLDNQ